MSDPLFVEERRRAIIEELRKNGRVSVKSLSETMRVSTVTIRQDLRALEDDGLLERTYGGAVSPVISMNVPELSFHVRQQRYRAEKTALGKAAAALVQDGYTIALDCSSTAYALVPYLKAFRKLTVLTNSLVIAQSFLDSPQIQVLLPSGRMRRDSISIVGRPDGLPDVNLNIGFMGARGVSIVEGITDVDPDEVTIKHAMALRCVSVVVLVDASKWGQVAPYTFLKPQQTTRIITTSDAPLALVEHYREFGVIVEAISIPA